MKSSLLIGLLILLSTISESQQSKTESHGKESKTTTKSEDESLNTVYTIEIKSKGVLKQKTVWKKDLENNWIKADSIFTPSGQLTSTTIVEINNTGKSIKVEYTTYQKGGVIDDKVIYEDSENDKYSFKTIKGNISNYDAIPGWKDMDYKSYTDEIDKLEKTDFSKSTAGIDTRSWQNPLDYAYNEIHGGPSLHRESSDGDGENFLGAILGYVRRIDERIAARGDAAVYFKKDGNTHLNKLFVMAGANFYPFKQAAFNNKTSFSFHGLAGLCSFTQKYKYNGMTNKTNESSFAWAAGGDVNFNFKKSFGLGFSVDYGTTKLFNNKQNNLRISAFVSKRL